MFSTLNVIEKIILNLNVQYNFSCKFVMHFFKTFLYFLIKKKLFFIVALKIFKALTSWA